jgi:UPF0716 protein FxsA
MTTGDPYPYKPPPRQQSGPGTPGAAPARHRSRTRSLVALGAAAWAVLEIWLLTVVADAAGGLTVLALIVGAFVLGVVVIKRAGRRAWRDFAQAVRRPGTEHGDDRQVPPRGSRTNGTGNALAMLGGLLLMLPGLTSDGIGLLLLFPPTVSLVRRVTDRYLARKGGFATSSLEGALQQVRIHRPDGKIVQGEVIREEGDGDDRGETRT